MELFNIRVEQSENNGIHDDVRLLDQFCRLCLRQRLDLDPLLSPIRGVSVSEVFRAITGLEMTLEDTYPLKTCRTCKAILEYAFDIRLNFTESYQILETFLLSKTEPLIKRLSDYQGGVRATSETVAERMLRELGDRKGTVDRYEATQKLNSCQLQEEQFEPPVQIKQEPELILEPEELPDPFTTEAEAITDNAKPTAEEYCKKSNVVLQNKLDIHKCYICNEVFEATKDVRLHLAEHMDMLPYQCHSCTKETGRELKITSLNRLHSHFRVHVSAIKCLQCPHRTRTKSAMQTHMRTCHGQSTQTEYICEQCGKKFLNKRYFDHHIYDHKAMNESRFTCPYCDKKFPCKGKLLQHETIHTGKKPYQCSECARNFRLRRSLNLHLSRKHKKPKQGYSRTCKVEGCDYTSTSKPKFFYHKAKHELKFQCSQCSQCFATKIQLRIHKFVHTGVKEFSCQQCDESFRFKRSLDEHVAEHNNDRQYACKVCGKSFVRERNLKAHMLIHSDKRALIHSDKRAFECQHCGKKFKYSRSHANHENTHLEPAVKVVDRQHACKVCGKTFERARNLKEHMLIHSDKRAAVKEVVDPETVVAEEMS